jgi:hypothetical protein
VRRAAPEQARPALLLLPPAAPLAGEEAAQLVGGERRRAQGGQVREGTLIFAVCIGVLMQVSLKFFKYDETKKLN